MQPTHLGPPAEAPLTLCLQVAEIVVVVVFIV